MTAVHIDIIHGDNFTRAEMPKPIAATELVSPLLVAAAVPGAEGVR